MPTDQPEISADRFADHFRITLSPEICAWIDNGLWKVPGPGEFSRAVDLSRLVRSPEDFIWPALMPPDFLPLLGNGAGDWLCARIDQQSCVPQIVHWYHGGGDWIPWGNGLAEAILFDFVSPMLPGPRRRHAIEAEPRRPSDVVGDIRHPWMRWAMEHVASPVGDAIGRAFDQTAIALATDETDLAAHFIEHGVAEIAVRCELVQDEWGRRESVTGEGTPSAGVDWSSIRSHCLAVLRQTEELAWPWDWLGLAEQALGHIDGARSAWIQAATCSAFTDQSVRMKPASVVGLDTTCDVKFSIAMLRRWGGDAVSATNIGGDDYISGLLGAKDQTDARRFAFGHWQSRAIERRDLGDFSGAVVMSTRAGWDLGTEPMSVYGELLTQIAQDARSAGQQGRARLAEIHASVWAG